MQKQSGLRIDLGCGANKREGTIGIDIQPFPQVDYVLDIETQPLPFEDGSVEHVYSSHFLEHLSNPDRVFLEINRVCADNAQLELWTPFAWSNSALVLGHKFFFAEDLYMHICAWHIDFWTDVFHKRWILREFHYVIKPETLCYLKRHNISLDFGLRHLHNVAEEFGSYITVLTDLSASSPPIRRTFSTDRFAPRYEVKGTDSFEPTVDEVERAIRAFAEGDALPPLT